MSFTLYNPPNATKRKAGYYVGISKIGTITLSRDLVLKLGLEKGWQYQILWDGKAKQIGLRFFKESTGPSRSIGMPVTHSTAMIIATKFFEMFRIRLPSKRIELTPTLERDMLIINYPDVL